MPGPKVDGHAAVLGRMRAAFEAMASLYYAQQDGIRGDAYSEAVYRVEMLTPATLPTPKPACMTLPGIGDKLSDKMLELYYMATWNRASGPSRHCARPASAAPCS